MKFLALLFRAFRLSKKLSLRFCAFSDLRHAQIGFWLQRPVQIRKRELLDAERGSPESPLRREDERRHRRHVFPRLLRQPTLSRIVAQGKSVLFPTFPARPHVWGMLETMWTGFAKIPKKKEKNQRTTTTTTTQTITTYRTLFLRVKTEK